MENPKPTTLAQAGSVVATTTAKETSQTEGNQKRRNTQETTPRQRRRLKKRKTKQAAPQTGLQPLFESLEQCGEGEELRILCHHLQPNPPDLYENFTKIWHDLMGVLQKRYTSFKIHPFGSSYIGLAFKTSDFDFYVQIEDKHNKTNALLGRETASALDRSQIFKSSMAIPAKVPIVKTVHKATGYSCDINFTNSLGVCNSNFIQYILTFDYRIHPMIIVIKFWAQCHTLTGSGRMSNYCLVMMVLFYLQFLELTVLPPVSVFQAQIPKINIGFWNVAFNNTLTTVSRNTMTVCDLINGFFSFYNSFDFNNLVICPLYGQTYTRAQFAKIADGELPGFEAYLDYLKSQETPVDFKLSSPFCIQDPFDLSHNIGSIVTANHLAKIKQAIQHAVRICQQCAEKSSPSSVLLIRLFTESAPQPVVQPTNSVANVERRGRSVSLSIYPAENLLIFVRMYLAAQPNVTCVDEVLLKKTWVEKTHKYILNMLEDIYCVTVTEMTGVNAGVATGAAAPANALPNACRQFSLTGERDVWSSRKQIRSSEFLDAEIALSKKVYDNCQSRINLAASVTIATTSQSQVLLIFNDECMIKKSRFESFFNSVSSNIRRYLKAYFSQLAKTSPPSSSA